MGIYLVKYVSFSFKNEKGVDVEKTKTISVVAEDYKDAEVIFNNQNIKHKRIVTIIEDDSNTLGSMFPELMKLKEKLKSE